MGKLFGGLINKIKDEPFGLVKGASKSRGGRLLKKAGRKSRDIVKGGGKLGSVLTDANKTASTLLG